MIDEPIASFSEWTTISSVLRYAGGKSNVADFLVKCFPSHKLYVDLMCGGLSVTLKKPAGVSEGEWINDKYDHLINFFTVVKECPDEFIAYFSDEFVFDSERQYLQHIERLRKPVNMPDVGAAVALWMTQQQTFTARNAAKAKSYRYSAGKEGNKHRDSLPVDAIYGLYYRLNGVKVFCRDFRHIFEMLTNRYDDPSTFIFEDPPYWGVSGGKDYVCTFSWQDHMDLATLNYRTKCKFLLTINDHPNIRALYQTFGNGLYVREYDITYAVGTVHEGLRKFVKETKELLISNYDTKQTYGPLFKEGE